MVVESIVERNSSLIVAWQRHRDEMIVLAERVLLTQRGLVAVEV